MLLTVEYGDDAVELHFDAEGRDVLLKAINGLKPGDHTHLMTPSWAGNELTESKQGIENSLVNHLRLHLWAESN